MKNDSSATTEAPELEAKLRHYTELYDFAPASYLTLLPDSTIVQANFVAAQMLGVSRAKLVNQRFATLVTTADRPAFTALLTRTFASNALESGEVRLLVGGGGETPLVVRLRTALSADRHECRLILTDVTARKQAEAMLRFSEQRWRTTFEAIGDALALIDADGRILQCNQAMEWMVGKPKALICGALHFEVVPGTSQPMTDCPFARAKTTKRREILEFTLGDRAMLMTVDPLLDTHLQFSGAVQVVADITERKWMEARLRHAQKTEAIGELAGGMAHEFNNLLASLMMNLELVKSMTLPAEAHAPLEEMGKLSRSAADLLGQVLTFGRQSAIRLRPVDLAVVIAEQVRLLSRVLGENIKVEFARAEIPAWINADQGAMEQVLLTLGLNARDAMKNGGVLRIQLTGAEVKAKTAAAHPDVQPGKFVCWSVSDTGCGMTPEIKRRLFEPFFTTKGFGQSTGLGLATVRSIVEQHHGWVEADSQVGKGSMFRVYLPAAAQPLPVPTTPAPSVLARGKGTILLVEDEPGLSRVQQAMLARCGYEVLTAADGLEALTVWEKHRAVIDLLYTDMVMPGKMTGLQLAQRVMADKPGVKVIITSGYTTDVQQLGEVSPAIVFVAKPCPPPQLISLIQTCLRAEGSNS